MKKVLLSLSAMAAMAFASDLTVYSGTVKYGVENQVLASASENVLAPIFIEAKDESGKSCTIFAHVAKAYGAAVNTTDLVSGRVVSVTCGKETRDVMGWVYDDKGNLGAKSLSAGTKVSVVLKPVVNAVNLTAKTN